MGTDRRVIYQLMVIATDELIVIADTRNVVTESTEVKAIANVGIIWQRKRIENTSRNRVQIVLCANRKQILPFVHRRANRRGYSRLWNNGRFLAELCPSGQFGFA